MSCAAGSWLSNCSLGRFDSEVATAVGVAAVQVVAFAIVAVDLGFAAAEATAAVVAEVAGKIAVAGEAIADAVAAEFVAAVVTNSGTVLTTL